MLFVAGSVAAQTFTIVVPSAAGSFQDTAARHVANAIGEATGMNVFVDNKPGAHGLVAVQHFMSLPKDGNSALLGSTVIPYVAKAHPEQHFDVLRDLVPIHGISKTDVVLAVSGKSSINSVADLIARYKSTGSLRAGVAAPQSNFLIRQAALSMGVRVELIRYKQVPQMQVDLTNNEFDLVGTAVPGAVALIQGGKIRPLAVFGSTRSKELPDVPTLKELGYKPVDDFAWSGLFMHVSAPPSIRAKIESAIKSSLASGGDKIIPNKSTAAELAAQVRREYELIVIE